MKRWFLMFAVSLFSLAVSAEEEPMIVVCQTNGQSDSYLRSDVTKITYEATDDNPSEVTIMRLHVKMVEDGETKVVTYDYNLADVESVDFKPPYAWVSTRANVKRTYISAELRGNIGGTWKNWPGVKRGFFISKSFHPITAEDRQVVYIDQVCNGPEEFTYNITNSQGYVGKVYYHYQAFASYQGEFFIVGGTQSAQFEPVTMQTDVYENIEEEDDEGHYYTAHCSADILGDSKTIRSEMANNRAEVGFCYGPDKVPTRAKGAILVPGELNEGGDIVCDIPHLEAGKEVWVRPYTIIADTIYYGLDYSIFPGPWVSVTTFDAKDVTVTQATVDFRVESSSSKSQINPGAVGLQYSSSSDLNDDDNCYDLYDWNPDKGGTQNFSGFFSKLTPNTTYYCRAYAVVNGKKKFGNTIEFTTKELNMVTYDAQNVTSTTAFIIGELFDTEVIEEGNYFGFFYNTTGNPRYSKEDPCVYGTFGSDKNSKFYWSAKNLKRGTKYYVRALITYKGATYVGNEISFTTSNMYEGEKGMFELRGPVYMCSWKNKWGTNYREFNQNGFWVKQDGKNLNSVYPYGIQRDSYGRIQVGTYDEGGNESWTVDQYGRKMTWTDVLWDGGETHSYYYDDNDVVYKETVEYLGMDEEWNDSYSVTYDSYVFDDYGNWIGRWAHTSLGENYAETREILYFE